MHSNVYIHIFKNLQLECVIHYILLFIWSLVIVSYFVLIVVDCSESVVCVDVVVVIDEYSSLPEVSGVGSNCIVWRVVCSVVIGSDVVVCSVVWSIVCSVVTGASQSIRKTCEGSVELSEILSCDGHEWYK